MRRICFATLTALLTIGTAQGATPGRPFADVHFAQASWVQMMPGGGAEVRAVSSDGCPTVEFDDGANSKQVPMQLRAVQTADFLSVCGAVVPHGVTGISIPVAAMGEPMGLVMKRLPVPVADPQRILVLGDTGCRIKGAALQACNDPKAWPFPGLAKAAAAQNPDLVIHLGDYLYRESACPATFPGCTGSPWGDNWASWDADFFTPAEPLLGAAPWIIIRGNHEDCYRAGPGFLRLLGPLAYDPAAPCNAHIPVYEIPIGSETLAILDSASAPDPTVDPLQVPLYQKDFAALQTMGGPGHELWLGTHRPLWGAISFMGAPAGGNATMIQAAGDLSAFAGVSLMLSGHIHSFEAIDYEAKLPPQIVGGNGGDNLDVTPIDLRGTIFLGESGVRVKTGFSVRGFGFLMLTREAGHAGWTIQLYDSDGHPTKRCAFENRDIFCLSPN